MTLGVSFSTRIYFLSSILLHSRRSPSTLLLRQGEMPYRNQGWLGRMDRPWVRFGLFHPHIGDCWAKVGTYLNTYEEVCGLFIMRVVGRGNLQEEMGAGILLSFGSWIFGSWESAIRCCVHDVVSTDTLTLYNHCYYSVTRAGAIYPLAKLFFKAYK